KYYSVWNFEFGICFGFRNSYFGFYYTAGADTSWYHCDALGSPRKMTNESGTVVWTDAYQPFGEMLAGTGNVHGFTGKELDAETGLNYFCLRYYDPQIGRFLTLDPFGGYIELPQTQMRYGYCINNPLKYIDPLGLDGEKWPDEGKTWSYKWGDYIVTVGPVSLVEWLIQKGYLRSYIGSSRFGGDGNPEGRLGIVEPSLEEIAVMNLGNPGFENAKYPFAEYYSAEKSITKFGPPPSGGTAPAKAIEFQRIIVSYVNWWNVNYPQHYTTAIPGIKAFQKDAWSCVEWTDALETMLRNLDLRFYTVHRLEMPSWYAPIPLFHNWIVLTSGSGFIWLDPWWYGSYLGIELGGD
ncbi:MAG: RHS repeat-associated core domain-containing protein, partial [candidate division WOR-3 bacterium]